MADGQVVFEITADGRQAVASVQDVTRAIQRESRNWDAAAQNSTNNIASSFSSMLKNITAAFSAVKIGKALLDFGKDAIEAASALEEVQNVVDVTFGESANIINNWAKQAGAAFGLTETQAKKYASTLGAMMKSSGIAGSEINKMSTDLAGLAADMASFYNLDFDTAFQKISSGISGETQPLKQLGINMSVANLNAFALEKGLEKTFEQMDSGEQTMLRYQYIMAQTADAQGDFARTSDGYANGMRKMETVITELETKLGAFLIGPATQVLEWVTEFVDSLLPDESRRTVLDEFNDIEIDTGNKLADIQKTASEAQALTEQLTAINEAKVDKIAGNIQGLADDLSNISFDQGKIGAFSDFLGILGANVDIVAAIQGTSAEEAAAWLETLANAANTLDENDAEGWANLIEQIRLGLPGIENTEFGDTFFSNLSGKYDTLGSKASVFAWAVDTLGSKTERTVEEQALWLEICRRLVQTIPSLSSIINTETGEIEGGTQAIYDNIDAWEKTERRRALLEENRRRRQALQEKYPELARYELDALMARKKANDKAAEIKAMLDEKGWSELYTENEDGSIGFKTIDSVFDSRVYNGGKAYNQLVAEYTTLVKDAAKAEEAWTEQVEAYNEGLEIVEEQEQAIIAEYGDLEEAADDAAAAASNWSEETQEAARNAVNNAGTALQELGDYYEQFREKVESSVDSVVKGFDKMERPTQKYRDELDKLIEEQRQYKPDSDEYKKLQERIDSLNESLEQYSTGGMAKSLDSQLAFMNDYLANLEKVKGYGVSDAFLAFLSDGSTESAEYLTALAADPSKAREIDQKWQEVQEKKKTFTDRLTENQLTVDEVYQQMLADAQAAVEGLDLEEEAAENSGKTVEGIAQGIRDNVDDVADAVDAVLAQIDRLSAWGITFDLGYGTGPVTIDPNATRTQGEFATGLDWVPFDGFLASLHEGESILTAEENRIWQKFKNGGSSIDYDTMGGVMRDNIKPGGNVYLNGRVVGSVISDQQGASYRQMQRSGFQA